MFKNWWYRTVVLVGLLCLLSGFSPPLQEGEETFDVAAIVDENFPDRVVKIGVKADFCPFSCLDGQDLQGVDPDLAREFIRRWFGIDEVDEVVFEIPPDPPLPAPTADEVRVEFVLVTQDEIPVFLEAGVIDFAISGITHTQGRDILQDFSITYFVDGQGLMVHVASPHLIRSIDDLANKEIRTIEGTTSDCDGDVIQELKAYLNGKLTCEEVENVEQAVEEVLANPELIFVSDSIRLVQSADQYDELAVVKDEFGSIYTFTDEPYAVEMAAGTSLLRELINATLQAMKEDGMLDALIIKHLPERTPLDIVRVPGDISALKQAFSKLELIETRDQIVVIGVKCDTPPFGVLEQGADEPEGFDVDLGRAIADLWDVDPRFVCVTSSNRIEKLRNNEIDMIIASMTKTWPRAAFIAFSNTYFFDGQSLLVKVGSGIEQIEDLNGEVIGALDGSTSCTNIDKFAPDLDKNCEFTTTDEALEALENDEIIAFTSDSVILSEFAKQNPDLEVVGGLLSEEPYGIGLPQGDFHFINLVNCSLQQLKQEGIYNEIYGRYFPEAVPYPVEIFPGELDCDYDDAVKELPEEPVSTIAQVGRGLPITVGLQVDFAPMNENGEGFDADLAREFSRRWYEDDSPDPQAIGVIELTAAERRSAIQNGRVDLLIAALTHTQDRQVWQAQFGQTYFLDGQSLLVPSGSGISSVLDLAGRVVGIIEDTTSEANLNNAIAAQQSDGDDEITYELETFETPAEALEALEDGSIDAFISDSVTLSEFVGNGSDLMVVGGLISDEPYTMAVPEYDAQFLNLVNRTLQEMKRDGTYDALYCKWFPDNYKPYEVQVWPDRADTTEYEGVNIAQVGTPLANPCATAAATTSEEERPAITTENATTYTVQSGDTLIDIAESQYGDSSRWQELYNDNRDIIGDDHSALSVGMELRLRR